MGVAIRRRPFRMSETAVDRLQRVDPRLIGFEVSDVNRHDWSHRRRFRERPIEK